MNLWEKMGLKGKVAIIVHEDDLGASRGHNEAYKILGFPTGAVMMACPFASAVSGPDIGVHLTITSEWDEPRFAPLSNGKSLRDEQGYFWKTLPQAWANIKPQELEVELRAQIEAAIGLGLDITHLDTHMGALLFPDFAKVYMKLGLAYKLPILIPEQFDDLQVHPLFVAKLKELIAQSPLPGFRIINGYGIPAESRRDWYIKTLTNCQPGVYHFLHHAAAPLADETPFPDGPGRTADFDSLQDRELKQVLNQHVSLTYREVRDALRESL